MTKLVISYRDREVGEFSIDHIDHIKTVKSSNFDPARCEDYVHAEYAEPTKTGRMLEVVTRDPETKAVNCHLYNADYAVVLFR